MPDLSTTGLLDAWESGLGVPARERTPVLLAAADPHVPADAHEALPLGARNAQLLALRRWAFGSRLDGVVQCGRCGADLELAVDADELDTAPGLQNGRSEAAVRADGYEVRFRLPDGRDDREAGCAGTVDAAYRLLLDRCVTTATRDGEPVDLHALPDEVVARVEEAMEERDPSADIRFALECGECGHAFVAPLDVGGFVWAELDQWARRTLVDVATLASAFGWPEEDVLALTPLRRRAYLELVGR